MSQAFEMRIARLERACHGRGDWRQFGDDPREMPDWPLDMEVREEIEERLKLAEQRQLSSQAIRDARAAVEAGEIHCAIQLILTLTESNTAGPTDARSRSA